MSAVKDKDDNCRVCGESANGLHFGCLTCRACSEFFRRTAIEKKKYECAKNKDCKMQKAMRYSCKFCRMKLCLENGMKVECVQAMRKRLKIKSVSSIDKTLFTDLMDNQNPHQTLILEMPPSPMKIIEKMANGIGSYKWQQRSLFTLLFPENDPDTYQHVQYKDYIQMARGCNSLVFNTLNDYFPSFDKLELELKESTMRTFSIHFAMLFQSYQTMLKFPEVDDSRFILHCGQLISCDGIITFHGPNKTPAITLTEKIGYYCGRLIDKMRLLRLREIEMASILGIKLWNELALLSKSLCLQAEKEQQQIYSDLYIDIKLHYGILKSGARFGSLLLLLNDLDAITNLIVEIFTMDRVFNLFELTN